MLIIIIISIIIWLTSGYMFWRAIHYGTLKFFYVEYKKDYTKWIINRQWYNMKELVCIVGPINIIVSLITGLHKMPLAHGLTFNFKMPKDAIEYED